MTSRFTLSTLLMFTMIVGASTNLVVAIYWKSRPIEGALRPIQWETFTYAKAKALQRAGTPVLFFANPTYHLESQVVRQRLDHSRIATASHRGELAPLIRTFSDWEDPEIHLVWKRFGHTKGPMILLFKPDGSVTRIDPFDTREIERQLAARPSIPLVPLLMLFGTLFLAVVIHYTRMKQTEQCRTQEDGIGGLQMDNRRDVPGDG